MKLTLTGTIKVLSAEEKVNDNLSRKNVVLTIDEDSQYPQDIALQALNNKIELFSSFNMGDAAKITCDLRGRNKDGKYYNNLVVIDVERAN